MKIIYATDLHGSPKAYSAIFNSAEITGCEAILIGGDILPKRGFINDSISGQREFIEKTLRPMLEEFRRKHPDIPIYWMFGNDDWAVNTNLVRRFEEEGLAELVHNKAVRLDNDFGLAGYSFVPVTPFGIKDWDKFDAEGNPPPIMWSQPVMSGSEGKFPVDLETDVRARGTIEQDLAELAKLSDPAKTIYMFHSPPFGTSLDLTDRNEHVGSRAIRDFVLRKQPPLTLHGHVHESAKVSGSITEKLGSTLSVNPGSSDYDLCALLFDTSNPDGTMTRYGKGWKKARHWAPSD
jgi:Icc-related predicted phosphoesterase